MYLPCWTDRVSFRDQYDVTWITWRYSRALKTSPKTAFFSLLPLRFYGTYDGYHMYDTSYTYKNMNSCGRYLDGYELCRETEIRNSETEYALRVWEKSAEIIKEEYHGIENITFGKQKTNGIYPIRFAYPLKELAERQVQLIKELIDGGFTIDEYLDVSYGEDGRRKTWHYKGVCATEQDELRKLFYHHTPYGEPIPVELKKNVSYPYEVCRKYYKKLKNKVILLGNQPRIYPLIQKENEELFEAIKNNDRDRMIECVKKGYSLNAINAKGNTAFAEIVFGFSSGYTGFKDIAPEEIDFLDILYAYGVNPAIFGTQSEDRLLLYAVIEHKNKLAEWLLKKGVNPTFFPFTDGWNEITLLDWLEDSWYEDMREKPDSCKDVVDMIKMLSKYS